MKALRHLILTTLLSALAPLFCPAQGLAPLSTEELIEEAAKGTDMTTDALGLLYQDKPALFDNLKDTMTAAKVVDQLFAAQDTEALATIAEWQWGKAVDAAMEKLVPAPALSALAAAKAYKSALELIRDHIVVPAFDEKMYAVYKEHRTHGGASSADAFSEATTVRNSGYYLVKTRMLSQLSSARGWNEELVGERLKAGAEKRIDDFWATRMEARLQQELCRNQAAEIQARLAEARLKARVALQMKLPQAPKTKSTVQAPKVQAPTPPKPPAKPKPLAPKPAVPAAPVASAPAPAEPVASPKAAARVSPFFIIPDDLPSGWYYVNWQGKNLDREIEGAGKPDEDYGEDGNLHATGGVRLGAQEFYISKDPGYRWSDEKQELITPSNVDFDRFARVSVSIVDCQSPEKARAKVRDYATRILGAHNRQSLSDNHATWTDSEGARTAYAHGRYFVYLVAGQVFPRFPVGTALLSELRPIVDRKLAAAP